ncbi:bifunctional hydroxymethylpyrimidine kinase/phosphomethylpyrimidine kinase [Streptococcus ferus]|uniref:bifunctional hydroxymethylpyrimidine kinase/phosphomethylpyrimidine kinase n=1 Tax=Streptococcus ferus TaxID=1345 RepID=UPI0035A1759B
MKTDYILAISGSDILSGGGMQADLATFNRHQLFGFVALTSIATVTDDGFEVNDLERPLFQSQLQSLKGIPFAAIKIGLLPNPDLAEVSLAFIKNYQDIPIVLDPVLIFKENQDGTIGEMAETLLSFLPYVSLITPNLREAEILSGKTITNLKDMRRAAERLHRLGADKLVIKGGARLDKHQAIDLFYDGSEAVYLKKPLLHRNNNGAGCTFAASIASAMAKGQTALEAVKAAKIDVYRAIHNSNQYGVKQNDH